MIDRRELMQLAENLGLQPQVVEKDYVLGWLLAGIRANADLAEHWVFKGGTCLKKCYFETYRFSEDLDYTVTDEAHLDQALLIKAFTDISAWIYEESGIEIPADRLRFDVFRNKRNRLAAEGRVYYRGPIAPRGDLPRIKFDLTTDELLALPPVERPVVHPYSDAPEGGITARCYAYEEVFGEKVRALGERARPRDLYDVINLFRHDDFQPQPGAILDVLKRKCDHKGIQIPTLDSITAFYEELSGDWQMMLAHQLPALPPLESFWNALPEFFAWLAGGVRPAMPQAYPLAAGDEIIRQPLGTLSGPGMVSSALEIIRFAAANRLTVEIDYVKENGERTTREIEAYSLRRTRAGAIVLHGFDINRNDHRSYRTDRIRGARATGRTFIPKYAVELTPGGIQAIPPTARTASATGFGGVGGARRTSATRASQSFGPTYVYQCPVCSKKFTRHSQDGTLRAHKAPGGWACSGRTGYLLEIR
ncbi:MAG: WYL domain-containing protein [Rhodospirillaceae bacterium]|nr:MAG: WYL domain-containing protein [Rhodospirillaceae bacterium]